VDKEGRLTLDLSKQKSVANVIAMFCIRDLTHFHIENANEVEYELL
jgi:hypothetical protein